MNLIYKNLQFLPLHQAFQDLLEVQFALVVQEDLQVQNHPVVLCLQLVPWGQVDQIVL